jgi:hypothetical protein
MWKDNIKIDLRKTGSTYLKWTELPKHGSIMVFGGDDDELLSH